MNMLLGDAFGLKQGSKPKKEYRTKSQLAAEMVAVLAGCPSQ
jgi:hypothetical protein